MMMISELPEDLLEEIFFRLPATSLIRLRSTCKQWNLLFKDRIFTAKHLDKAPKQFQSLMLKASGVCLMRFNIDRSTVKGEASLTDSHSRVDQIKILKVSHCEGLLLCYVNTRRLVVWNPCTGQTEWIRPRNSFEVDCSYALGSYQDKKSNGNSYKILRLRWLNDSDPWTDRNKQEFEIYEINSNAWRILDVTIDFGLDSISWGVSLKGKSYWIGTKVEFYTFTCIVSFDYTTERFEHLCFLPYQDKSYQIMSLTLVREEKLAVLLEPEFREKAEIWLTNKISETKEVSWSKVFAVDFDPWFIQRGSFLVDEENKVLVFCESVCESKKLVYIVGEDNIVRRVDSVFIYTPWLFNYVPSLTRLQERKRKRGE